MKLSELKFSDCTNDKKKSFLMHYNATDCLREIKDEKWFEITKSELLEKIGHDCDVKVDWNGIRTGGDFIVILDEGFQRSLNAHDEAKMAWCEKYGSN